MNLAAAVREEQAGKDLATKNTKTHKKAGKLK
jgi:hypothetical protein